MKNLLKKAYENNYVFYSAGALSGFLLFIFTFKSFSDFLHREFIEAFSLFLSLSFLTVMILELKTAFFPRNEEELEHVEVESEEIGVRVEEESKILDSGENKISNPESDQSVYEWDEVEKEEPDTTKAVEKEQGKEQQVKPKIQKKKAIPIVENEDAPAEAAGFVPEQDNDPFS